MATKKHTDDLSSHENHRTNHTRLYRSETNRVLGGVSGGIGEYVNIDPTLIRIAFVLLTVFGGSGVLLYLALWLVVPTSFQGERNGDHIRENIDEMKGRARSFAESIKADSQNPQRSWWAIFFIGLGLLFIFNNFGMFHIEFDKLWPLILIFLGIFLLRRR